MPRLRNVLTCIVLLQYAGTCIVFATINCVDILKQTIQFVGSCSNQWKNVQPLMKPTQAQVGFSWIRYKLDDFTDAASAQTAVADATPVVIGPDNYFYVVDDHHTLCALDYSGYSESTVILDIVCDKRGLTMDQFWKDLSNQNLVNLVAHPNDEPNALPIKIQPSDLPPTFHFAPTNISFTDDPWRSLAGFSRKVTAAVPPAPACDKKKYCERCMFRGCVDGYGTSGPSVPYFEFLWAYFMLDSTFFAEKNWPSAGARKNFTELYLQLPHDIPVSEINTSLWFDTANAVIPLCREGAAPTFKLPADLYAGNNGSLPGFVVGYEQLPNDPDCNSPRCS